MKNIKKKYVFQKDFFLFHIFFPQFLFPGSISNAPIIKKFIFLESPVGIIK